MAEQVVIAWCQIQATGRVKNDMKTKPFDSHYCGLTYVRSCIVMLKKKIGVRRSNTLIIIVESSTSGYNALYLLYSLQVEIHDAQLLPSSDRKYRYNEVSINVDTSGTVIDKYQ